MIARFAEHQVQLPGNFGSYQLVGWNIEPLAKRYILSFTLQHPLAADEISFSLIGFSSHQLDKVLYKSRAI